MGAYGMAEYPGQRPRPAPAHWRDAGERDDQADAEPVDQLAVPELDAEAIEYAGNGPELPARIAGGPSPSWCPDYCPHPHEEEEEGPRATGAPIPPFDVPVATSGALAGVPLIGPVHPVGDPYAELDQLDPATAGPDVDQVAELVDHGPDGVVEVGRAFQAERDAYAAERVAEARRALDHALYGYLPGDDVRDTPSAPPRPTVVERVEEEHGRGIAYGPRGRLGELVDDGLRWHPHPAEVDHGHAGYFRVGEPVEGYGSNTFRAIPAGSEPGPGLIGPVYGVPQQWARPCACRPGDPTCGYQAPAVDSAVRRTPACAEKARELIDKHPSTTPAVSLDGIDMAPYRGVDRGHLVAPAAAELDRHVRRAAELDAIETGVSEGRGRVAERWRIRLRNMLRWGL
jgi:hypothetical protein